MSQKQFSILIGAGILCAFLFAAPGLYTLAKEYRADSAKLEAKKSKGSNWHDMTRDEEYQSLSPQAKLNLKQRYFERTFGADKDFQEMSEKGKQAVFQDFMRIPDDTGQGYFSSMLCSAVRGMCEIVPGTIEGIGALADIKPVRKAGQEMRGGLEEVVPLNPIHAERVPTKLAFWLGILTLPSAIFAVWLHLKKRKLTVKL